MIIINTNIYNKNKTWTEEFASKIENDVEGEVEVEFRFDKYL
jgi:hypothetical protein